MKPSTPGIEQREEMTHDCPTSALFRIRLGLHVIQIKIQSGEKRKLNPTVYNLRLHSKYTKKN